MKFTPHPRFLCRTRSASKEASFLSAERQKLPQTTVAVDDPETLEKVLKLLEMLDDNDDVMGVPQRRTA